MAFVRPPDPNPKNIRSLALWMAPPAYGWRRRGRRGGSASRALMQPLAALGIILLMVGFVGLLIMQQSIYHSFLFGGIGDLQRQARYIVDLAAPPTDAPRLRMVLDEFDSRLRRLTVDLRMPVTVNDTVVPWRSSPAQDALVNLATHWQVLYHPNLLALIDDKTNEVRPEASQAARELLQEIDSISAEASEAVRTQSSLLFMAQVGLLLLGAMATVVIVMRVNHQLLEPLAHLRNWASRMRGGNLGARIPAPAKGDFAELAGDINALGADLQNLTRDMDNQVRHQTERLAQKTHSLQVLYDIASNINSARDMDDLLTCFLRTITELVGAVAAAVRLVTDDNQMRLVASIGLDSDIVERERLVPIGRCLCGTTVISGELRSQPDLRHCAKLNNRPMFAVEGIEVIAVPLMYRDRTLGIYNLFLDPTGLTQREEMKELLTSIGKHLGMAVEKARLDTESKRLSIIQERTMLAHELHDSLAQTLAGLRFQSKMLEETLEKGEDIGALGESRKIRAGVEDAHTELRELLVHFRARMDERGLIPALEEMLEGFRNETRIATFFQNECQQLNLSPDQEVQVLHIVQEALTNVRKHSGARNVRLLLHCDKGSSGYRILVEDDGNGLVSTNRQPLPGEHVGLSIMQERARRLGGTLRVEGEPGDGTRVELTCVPHPATTHEVQYPTEG